MPPPTTRVGVARVRCIVGPCPVLSLERELAAADRVAGEPDAGGFYSKVNRNVRDMSAKGAAPGTDSKGRIGA